MEEGITVLDTILFIIRDPANFSIFYITTSSGSIIQNDTVTCRQSQFVHLTVVGRSNTAKQFKEEGVKCFRLNKKVEIYQKIV